MKKYPLAATLLLFALYAHSPADTITLKSGEKLQGRIVTETTADVTMEVKVSASISDERVISRDDIQLIDKSTPDQIEFLQIKDLAPDPITADATTIDRIIGRLNAFVEKYPKSTELPAVKEKLDLFQKEKAHLAKGEVKYYGSWISKEEAAKRKVQITGAALFAKMKQLGAEGNFVGALNAFDQLEKIANGSQAYPAAVAYEKQLVTALSTQIKASYTKLQHDTEEWNKGVIITDEQKKPQIIAARKAEMEQYSAIIDAAQKNGSKWPPLIPQSDKSLSILSNLLGTEITRLAAIPVDSMNASLQETAKGTAAVSSRDYATAEPLLKEAIRLWPQNEEATYLTQVVVDEKAKAGKESEASAKAAESAAKAPKPKPAASAPAASTPAQAATEQSASEPPKPTMLEFFMTVPGALVIVGIAVGLLLVVALLQKFKKPKAEEA